MMRKPLFIAATLLTQTLAGATHAAPPEQVTFTSGGEKIVGLLYRPADAPAGHRLPVVVVAPPWLNVKEQVATRYAQALSDRGVAALAFDYRHWGQSGGAPRELESATAKVADIREAVAFLKTRGDVAADRVGLLGICFGAGHALTAAAGDADVKAVATVAAWLHDRPTLVATFGRDEVDRRYRVAREARARWEKDPAATDYVPAASNTDRAAGMYAPDPGFFYTNARRGAVPEWTNRMAVMSWTEWLDLDGVAAAAKVTQPLLVVHSDASALPDNVRKAFAAATGPKDLLWTQGEHTQFYDEPAHVAKAADAVAAHFRRTLVGGGGKKEAANPGGAGVRPASDAAVREFFAALEAMDVDRFLNVWADDGVQEMPYAPGDFPKRLEGKEAIRRQYGPLPQAFKEMRFPIRRLIPAADPRTVVAEYGGGIALRSGGRYDNTYVGVFTFDGAGKLKHFTEYFDPFTLVRGFPGADAVGAPAEEQVTAVLRTLPAAADARDWAAVRAVFADEVDVDYTSVTGGKPGRVKADELVTAWSQGLGVFRRTKHNFGDFKVAIDGNAAATATFTGIATHEKTDGGRWTCGGDYTYRLAKSARGWRVVAAKFDMTWEQGGR